MTDRDSIRSLSPIVIDDYHSRNSVFSLSSCGCFRKRNEQKTKSDVEKGFFKRIQLFKAQKRQSSVRKQQLAIVSNGYSTTEIDRSSESPPSSSSFIRNAPSISFLHGTDSYSFADIELASSVNERKPLHNPNATPKSIVSHNLSLATTNLSSCSTQSLLRKLLDKAQLLDDYYKDFSSKPRNHSSFSLSSSANSLLGKSETTSRSFRHRHRSYRRNYRHLYENISSESSRFNLYVDEDNILRELVRFNNDIDVILSRLGTDRESIQATTNDPSVREIPPTLIDSTDVSVQVNNDREEVEQTISTMRTDTNEIDIHSLLANDINRLRETALSKLLQMMEDTGHSNNETITLNKLNKLPKSPTWKGKRVFGVPLRIYQQTTGHLLPIGIINALQYICLHAGKCEGLFRKPGVKSKIDHLRTEIERTDGSSEMIKFDEYQPFVVADVIRQYFRELPECLIPPLITRLLCDLLQYVTPDEQLLAIRYTFLLIPDETREVLEIILRFLFDVSIRLGNSQTTCRSLARIFLPSVFQSYYSMQQTSSKVLWWKWKKEKSDARQQENGRLILEQCLMTMIFNVDLLCRIPSTLSDELKLPSAKQTKRLDELVRNECNGDFHLKKYISKKTEQFLQRLSNRKFKTIPTNLDDVNVSVHKPSATSSSDFHDHPLPTWKCSIDIPNTSVKQIHQRLLHERCLWENSFAEGRTIEKINNDKEIMQYVLNSHDLPSIRSFCEFRFSKKVTSRSVPDANAIVISSTSIDHLQNHFLPGTTGITYEMDYYLAPSTTNPAHTTVTQIACVDYGGRSSQWYENVYGSLLAHNLISLRDTFTNSTAVRI